MKVLIFEYATAMGLEDPEFLLEGRAMLEGLLDDFNKIDYSRYFEVSYLIAEKLLKKEYLQKWDVFDPLIVNFSPENFFNLENWLESNISNFEACIFVAAEENLELYKLTKIIESKGVNVLGSTAKAVLKSSDKLETYEYLKKYFNNNKNVNNDINLIETYKIDLNEFKNEYKEKTNYNSLNHVSDKFSDKFSNLFDNNNKMLIKPADGVACQGIKVLNSLDELFNSLKSIKTSLPYVLLQDFVEGQPCSVSLLSDGINAIPLSLNLQKIEFENDGLEYFGGEVPWDHPLKFDALEMAKNIVESIDGLKGYIGVDLIISDKIYFIEINSRLTTPYVALRNVIDINLGQAIADSSMGSLPDDFNLSGCFEFRKGNESLDITPKN